MNKNLFFLGYPVVHVYDYCSLVQGQACLAVCSHWPPTGEGAAWHPGKVMCTELCYTSFNLGHIPGQVILAQVKHFIYNFKGPQSVMHRSLYKNAVLWWLNVMYQVEDMFLKRDSKARKVGV